MSCFQKFVLTFLAPWILFQNWDAHSPTSGLCPSFKRSSPLSSGANQALHLMDYFFFYAFWRNCIAEKGVWSLGHLISIQLRRKAFPSGYLQDCIKTCWEINSYLGAGGNYYWREKWRSPIFLTQHHHSWMIIGVDILAGFMNDPFLLSHISRFEHNFFFYAKVLNLFCRTFKIESCLIPIVNAAHSVGDDQA